MVVAVAGVVVTGLAAVGFDAVGLTINHTPSTPSPSVSPDEIS